MVLNFGAARTGGYEVPRQGYDFLVVLLLVLVLVTSVVQFFIQGSLSFFTYMYEMIREHGDEATRLTNG